MRKVTDEPELHGSSPHVIPKYVHDVEPIMSDEKPLKRFDALQESSNDIQDTQEIVEESLSLADKEIELIKKALEKHSGKRKHAAGELGISERTLYRKIKEFNIE
jgi:transcriptional regulator with PAS, ATPase and Fis domain